MSRHHNVSLSLVHSLRGLICTAALGLAVFASAVASAAPIVIDDFGQPNPEQFYVIAAINADPLLHKTAHPSILGGERDLLVDVVGSAALTTAAGTVGGGELNFGTSGPVLAMLQYDGVDADQLLPTRALVNAQGLTVDLTGSGTNNALRLDFDSIDGGPPSTPLSYTITLTSPLAGVATRTGTLAEAATAQSYLIPFASFTPSVNFAFTNVSSITLTLNGGVTQPDSDFQLSLFSAVPEPHSVALLGIGGVALLVAARKRRRV